MPQGIHLISNGIQGSVVPDARFYGRSTASSYSYLGDQKLFHGANVLQHFPAYNPIKLTFTCKANSNNHRRNPDFSRQHRGSSRGKSRQYRERENPENLEETEVLPSKNGPTLSLPGNQRYQATATPGRREKEIVELFRKVQAQLRARAAIKEEKKMEASQQGPGEKGTVDSLLKLLRKHSLDQGKKSGNEEDLNLDQQERRDPFEDEQSPNFFTTSSIAPEEVHHLEPITPSRPVSQFKRKSPVPRIKFQPVLSPDEGDNSYSSSKSQGRKSVINEQELDAVPEILNEPDKAFLDDLSDVSDTEVPYEEPSTNPSAVESPDLGSMKLSELRVLAKSRGLKGYSKLKKGELVELLSGDGA